MALALKKSTTSAHRLTAEIMRQRNDPTEQERTAEKLRSRVRACEVKFNIRSSDIHRAIDAGDLVETAEVCRWIMDYDMLVRAGKA